jgi:hypothetical protein
MQDVLFQLSSLKKVSMPYIRGYEEDGFMKQLDVSRQELEILAPDKVSTDDVIGCGYVSFVKASLES